MLDKIVSLLEPDVSTEAKLNAVSITIGKAVDRFESRLDTIEIKTLIPIERGERGRDGKDGRNGKDGLPGRDEVDGVGIPGKDGPAATLSGVVNTYYPGFADVVISATSIPVGSARAGALFLSHY